MRPCLVVLTQEQVIPQSSEPPNELDTIHRDGDLVRLESRALKG